jgi:hypothetical protein
LEVDLAAILESLGSAKRFADPKAPLEARLMAASGALPLSPPQISVVLFALTFDAEAEVKDRALQSLQDLPDRVLDAVLPEGLPPALLAWFAEHFREDGPRLEQLALNPATSDETIVELATLPFLNVVEIISNNQLRLVRCPGIIEALGDNRLTGQSTIDRILDFLGLREETEEEDPQQPAAPEVEGVDLDSTEDLPPELLEDSEDPDADLSEDAENDERSKTMYALVQDMNVVQKIKLARFGSGEARSILVRDSNKIVATAAVRSPKVKESEVISMARSRNICEEVMRIIAANRDWTKSYAIQLALATNPKSPIRAAMKFINYLSDRDLKLIMRSREVSGAISAQARRILAKKGKI